jgi:predicted nucleic acid-binding protein
MALKMLKPLFVDTGYVIALINQNDQYHHQAQRLAEQYEGYPLVTTDAVLLEIGNALSRIAKTEASQILRYFQQADEVTLIHMNPVLFRRALEHYEQYQDKSWGLVDCLSFIVMREMEITTALAFDNHFVQAGFLLVNESGG